MSDQKITTQSAAVTTKPSASPAMPDELLHGIQFRAVTDMPTSDRRVLLAEVERLRGRCGEPYTTNPLFGRAAF